MSIYEETRKIRILVLNDGKQISGEPYRTIKPYKENGQMVSSIILFVIERQILTLQLYPLRARLKSLAMPCGLLPV